MSADLVNPTASRPVLKDRAAVILACLAVVLAACLAVAYAGQIPLDRHSFRQTQTALTAYWFMQEGYRLVYETPVGGYPWAIPFEFPLYQYIIAGISQTLGASLDRVGRLVSFGFLLLCIPAVASINRRLGLPGSVLAYFVALIFTAPVYLYWGRAILIETTALFFAVLAIKFALDYLLGGRAGISLLVFSLSMTASILQKATTGLPVLLVLGAAMALGELRLARSERRIRFGQWTLVATALFVPLAAGYGWTRFTDLVKQQNPLGRELTSSALSTWNWGTAAQRLSSDFWVDVIFLRVLAGNLGAVLGLGLIAVALAGRTERRIKAVIAVAAVLGILPLFLFTNLHIVHDYYQASNLMFLVYAVAVALGAVVAPQYGARTATLLAAGLMASNLVSFARFGYLDAMTATFDRNDRDAAIGEILKRELPADAQFVAFGNDYSSTFAYLSQRKSFGVPAWFKDTDDVIASPGDYVERGRLGAVVSCADRPDAAQLIDFAARQPGWKVAEAAGCMIALPERPLEVAPVPGACQGSIDTAEVAGGKGLVTLRFLGWSAPDPAGEQGGDVFIALSSAGAAPIYIDTLRIPRLDANAHLGTNPNIDLGFSRLASVELAPGNYTATVVQRRGDHAIACPMQAQLQIPG